mmetsp:Transcript_13643/g.29566  ORF Transcript_13643/g.29566 Transcript_13643/m.29566 type:complete len:81 (+) Transcript_13643:1454-1696(+)
MSIPLFHNCYPEAADYVNNAPIARESDCTYVFGMDPVWNKSGQTIDFYNSYKMKLAICVGIIQMTFGVCLKGLNNIHYGH